MFPSPVSWRDGAPDKGKDDRLKNKVFEARNLFPENRRNEAAPVLSKIKLDKYGALRLTGTN